MLIDANVLLFARDSASERHHAAREFLEDALNGPTRVGLPWPSLTAFLRIATHPRVYVEPLTTQQAWTQVESWLAAPASWVPVPTTRHAEVLGELLRRSGVTGNLMADAHLAALAIEHGLELCSSDSDFARFPGLRWRDPTVA